MTASRPFRILYLVHDLNDAAVSRRAGMLQEGGASLEIAGFYRGAAAPEKVGGTAVWSFGQSFDAQLGRRAMAVGRLVLNAGAVAKRLAAPDVIVARNLEMLALAVALAPRFANRPKVIYECLDIHRLMLGEGIKSRLMRGIERRLLAKSALLMISSPAFLEHYFKGRQDYQGPASLVENKAPVGPVASVPAVAPRPPWRIGWFGMLRCSRSLDLLSALVAASDGKIEVLLAGKPAYTEFADFDADVARTPGLTYVGPYKPADLSDLYASVHFTWAIDYFEEGLNSSWLLPNRLYEGAAHGAAPIALAGVETGRWLKRHGAGVLIDDPATDLPPFFEGLTASLMNTLRAEVAAIPAGDLRFDRKDCRDLVNALQALGK